MEWAMQESLRSSSNTPVQQNLFEPPAQNGTDIAYPAPRLPTESKPSPVSAASTTRPASRDSPVSPMKAETANENDSRGQRSNGSLSNERPSIGPTGQATGTSRGTRYPLIDISEPFDPAATPSDQWTCDICTCINPLQFLACDACGTEQPQKIGLGNRGARPKPKPRPEIHAPTSPRNASLGWICSSCKAFMEHRWWTCSACGKMKDSS